MVPRQVARRVSRGITRHPLGGLGGSARTDQKADVVASSPTDGFHRTDIDGLRAIAVGAVIWLHAGLPGLSGGFLGVDVFFVISGFLIHRDLTNRLRQGTFAPLAFYGRRMRRTLPALYLVVASTLVAAAFVSLPGDFDALARSAVATTFSVSNILFLTQVGYFDHDALTKPLLHTWSLGVEEQFYLFAPLLSLLLSKLRTARRPAAYAALLGLTFCGCLLLQDFAAPAAFFLMPPRLWEFLLGCAVADRLFPSAMSRGLAEAITLTALLAIGVSLALVTEHSPHPGLPTLAPCMATAAILHVGTWHRTAAARVLGWRPIAFVGLISYSLYLWHWPLIAFARAGDTQLTARPLAGLLLLMFVLSVLSWRFVEQPFRDPASAWRRRAAPVLASTAGTIVAASLAIVTARGLPQRFPAEIARIAGYYDYANRRQFREGTCFLTSRFDSIDYFDKSACLGRVAGKPTYLLIGDSLAAHFWIGLSTVFRDTNILQATASGCKPLLEPRGKRYCTDLMTYTLRRFVPQAHLDGIIFSGAWGLEDTEAVAALAHEMTRFVPNVIVLGSVPLYAIDVPTLLAKSQIEHRPELVRENQLDYPWEVQTAFKAAIAPPAHYVSLVDLLCPDKVCVTEAAPGVPVEFDKSHMTSEGSILVARRLKAAGVLGSRE